MRARNAMRMTAGVLALGTLALTAPAMMAWAAKGLPVGQPCDNSVNASKCTVPATTLDKSLPEEKQLDIGPLNVGGGATCGGIYVSCGTDGVGPVALGGGAGCIGTPSGPSGSSDVSCGNVGAGPIGVGGNATCSGSNVDCGNTGVGPASVNGNASCAQRGPAVGDSGSCGVVGVGPVAIHGNASCSSDPNNTTTCGIFGVGPVAIDGNASCTGTTGAETMCGNYGVGPVAIGGNASCTDGTSSPPYSTSCGSTGAGPIATGNVTCSPGDCTSAGSIGVPGLSLLGHASCDDPATLKELKSKPTGLTSATCISVKDFLGLP
jgi:hypothetical protein